MKRSFRKCTTAASAIVLLFIGLVSCNRNIESGDNLSADDKNFIKKLGILDDEEEIILFDSQGGSFNGREISGNYFTDKRIASYWIDKRRPEKTSIEQALYEDIDTIWRYPKFRAVTLASYLEVHRKDGTKFRVYIDSDSVGTWNFFNKALDEWQRRK